MLSRFSSKESNLTFPHQILICGMHVLPLLFQFLRCAPKEDVLVQNQLNGWEDVQEVVHLYVEISLSGNTMETCSYSRYLLIVRTIPITIWSWLIIIVYNEPVQISINAPELVGVCIPPNSIVSDQNSIPTSKSWSSWYYFQAWLRLPPWLVA